MRKPRPAARVRPHFPCWRVFAPGAGSSGCGGSSGPGGRHTEYRRTRGDRRGPQRQSRRRSWSCRGPEPAPPAHAAHQAFGLAFHLRSGGPVVGDPTRVRLPGLGRGRRLLVDADADRPPGTGRGVHRSRSGHPRTMCRTKMILGDILGDTREQLRASRGTLGKPAGQDAARRLGATSRTREKREGRRFDPGPGH